MDESRVLSFHLFASRNFKKKTKMSLYLYFVTSEYGDLPSAALRRDSTDISTVGFIRVIGIIVAIRKESVYVAHDDCM